MKLVRARNAARASLAACLALWLGSVSVSIPAKGAQEAGSQQVLKVGPSRALKFPSEAAKIAGEGAIIEIDPGVYNNDYAIWSSDELIIRGIGPGAAHLKSTGLIPNGKAIWITRGNQITIENIEFSGAAVRDTNGAGIRHEGGDLTLRNTYFHHNEFSILAGRLPQAQVTVIASRFWFQQRPSRFSHGIYIGAVRRFTLMGSHFKGTDQGQQVKSRAFENHILYNRIEDDHKGNSSRLIDLPNCGFSIVMGNDLHQASTTLNTNIIGYGPEGCSGRTERQKTLFVINNTLVNEAAAGLLVRNFSDGHVTVANNLLFGSGAFLSGKGEQLNNFRHPLKHRTDENWNAPMDSMAIDAAIEVLTEPGISLRPQGEFLPPAGYQQRLEDGRLDAGSRERKQ